MLNAQDIRVRYGAQTAVDGVSFTLHAGEWLMLVGPNGAGKSSLLGALAQRIPYTGRIALDGTALHTMKPAQRARLLGLLAQHHPVGFDYTVEEVVRLGRYAHSDMWGSGDADGAAMVELALAQTGMEALRGHSLRALSGGEVQRAFLAQVLAQNPRVMLLDEPANHLDLGYQRHIFGLIGEWLQVPGRAVIAVVHDLSLARRYGTHALLLDHGAVAAQGTCAQALNADTLRAVYGMDVQGWMRELLGQWA